MVRSSKSYRGDNDTPGRVRSPGAIAVASTTDAWTYYSTNSSRVGKRSLARSRFLPCRDEAFWRAIHRPRPEHPRLKHRSGTATSPGAYCSTPRLLPAAISLHLRELPSADLLDLSIKPSLQVVLVWVAAFNC